MLVAVLIGAELAGVLGALAAIPIGGSLQVIVLELLSWRRGRSAKAPAGAVAPPSGPGPPG